MRSKLHLFTILIALLLGRGTTYTQSQISLNGGLSSLNFRVLDNESLRNSLDIAPRLGEYIAVSILGDKPKRITWGVDLAYSNQRSTVHAGGTAGHLFSSSSEGRFSLAYLHLKTYGYFSLDQQDRFYTTFGLFYSYFLAADRPTAIHTQGANFHTGETFTFLGEAPQGDFFKDWNFGFVLGLGHNFQLGEDKRMRVGLVLGQSLMDMGENALIQNRIRAYYLNLYVGYNWQLNGERRTANQ